MQKSRFLVLAFLAMTSCNVHGEEALASDNATAVTRIREALITHAPYKQWDIRTGAGNQSIGRTPGGACEAIRFLARDAATNGNLASRAAAIRLSDWIVSLQKASRHLPIAGGVPSTPDLATPANTYHYAIDAVFCADAMMDMAGLTEEDKYMRSALAFGGFLLAMMRDENGNRRRDVTSSGLCEAVIQGSSTDPAWNCRRYTKSLMALPVLARLHALRPERGYRTAADQIRKTLMDGLEGFWEYAEGPVRQPQWRRIQGSHGEPDYFVYGDTLAYALQGLFRFEGASPDVRRFYQRLMDIRSCTPDTAGFDPRIALPGYITAQDAAPDPLSAYYDVVTSGLLHPVRMALVPDDARRSASVLRQIVLAAPQLTWHVNFSLRPPAGGMADISTLAASGLALLDAQAER